MDSVAQRADWRAPLPWLLPGVALGVCAGALARLHDWWLLALACGVPGLFCMAWWTLAAPARWFAGFCFATLLLPPLPFELGNTGPHPALLFAALGLWVGLLRWPQWRVTADALSLTLILFLGVLLLSVPLAGFYSGWSIAAGSLTRVLLFAIAIYTFFFFSDTSPSSVILRPLIWLRAVYYLGVTAALWACIDFYFQFSPVAGYSEQFVWLPGRVVRRAQGFFYDAGMLGNLCVFFLLLVVLAWLRPAIGRRIAHPAWRWTGGIILAAALLFSFSRGAVLNLLAALAVLLFLHRKRLPFRRLIFVVATIAAVAVAAAFWLLPHFVESYFLRLWATATGLLETPETLLAGRLQTWQALWDFAARHPHVLLTGVGFKTLPYSSLLGQPIVPDNMYVSLLLETGILGLGAMLLMLGAILHSAYQAARSSNQLASFLGVWSFCFWIGQLFQMLSVDALTYWRVLPIYFAVLAIAVREARNPAKPKTIAP